MPIDSHLIVRFQENIYKLKKPLGHTQQTIEKLDNPATKSYFHRLNVTNTLTRNDAKIMGRIMILVSVAIACIVSCVTANKIDIIENKVLVPSSIKYDGVESLLKQMTLDEKIGQMNQYSGFWNATGPTPKDGDAAQKYKNL